MLILLDILNDDIYTFAVTTHDKEDPQLFSQDSIKDWQNNLMSKIFQ